MRLGHDIKVISKTQSDSVTISAEYANQRELSPQVDEH
jgi:hypothetical protein